MLDPSKRNTAKRHLLLLAAVVIGVLVLLSILLPR
jgi:hypothetical protein